MHFNRVRVERGYSLKNIWKVAEWDHNGSGQSLLFGLPGSF